jgi:uroporphyrinogen-III synthase
MRVIVTRPAHDAQRWVRDLLALGLEAVALPLINIGPVDDRATLASAWQRLGDYVGVMFVSGNAVDHFFESKPALAVDLYGFVYSKTRSWAPGPGTGDALVRWGVQPGRIDMPAPQAGKFDSEALWQVVAPQVHPGDRVLIVRGGDSASVGAGSAGVGRDWLAQRLADRGAAVDFVVAYQRMAPDFSAHESSLARGAAADGSVWLFSSSEAIANLTALLPSQSWRSARALVTHPRIAQAATAAGFGVVQHSTPLFSEVVVSLQRMAQVAR